MPEHAAIIDLPLGHRDDPDGREGLAAIAARWIAGSPGTSLPGSRGWRTRHRLEAHCSSFSYWSALGDLGLLPEHFRSRLRAPSPDELAGLREAQSRVLRKRSGTLYLRMLDAIDEAALGRPRSGPLGTEASTARLSVPDVAAYLERCLDLGIRHHPGDSAPGPTGPPPGGGRTWLGGVVADPVPGETRTRVAVRLPLRAAALPADAVPLQAGALPADALPLRAGALPADAPPLQTGALPAGALPLLVESLGTGTEGRLIRRLRHDRPIAYGVAAMSWDDTDDPAAGPSIGGYALVAPEHAADAAEILLDTVREALRQPPSGELSAAALRCRTLLLVQVDQPFGDVTEQRTAARGGVTLVRLAQEVAVRARHGLDLRIDEDRAPALAITGAVDPDQLTRMRART